MSARPYNPDRCTACGDFLPCGDWWIETADEAYDRIHGLDGHVQACAHDWRDGGGWLMSTYGLTPNNLAIMAEVARDVLGRCTCTPYPAGEGPEIDCPMHGRADYQAVHITDALGPVIAVILAVQREQIAKEFETDAASAWGGDASWLTTGSKVAALAAEWVREGGTP